MKKLYSLMISIAAVASTAQFAFAHGEDPNTAGRPGDPKAVTRTVRIEATEIKFNMKALAFRAGETVKFVVVNSGEQDHEMTIGDRATQLEHRKVMEEMAEMQGKAMSGDAMHGHNHQDGSSVVLKPGETKELVWQFTTPGSFEFDCNFPGHAEAGMAGTIAVH